LNIYWILFFQLWFFSSYCCFSRSQTRPNWWEAKDWRCRRICYVGW